PGWDTPLFFYLTEHLRMSPEAYGTFKAVNFAGMAASTAVYGFFFVRVALGRLLWVAIILNIFPGFLFLFIHGSARAIVVAGTMGLLNGFAHVALFDLLMRSCPENSEGAASMLAISAFGIAGAAGDLLGAWLYQIAGLTPGIVIDGVATFLMLPLLQRYPASI